MCSFRVIQFGAFCPIGFSYAFTGELRNATYRLADGGGLAERPRRTILLFLLI